MASDPVSGDEGSPVLGPNASMAIGLSEPVVNPGFSASILQILLTLPVGGTLFQKGCNTFLGVPPQHVLNHDVAGIVIGLI